MQDLPPEALEQVAAYFQALAEPTRLQILNLLRQGEYNVGELAQACECTSANVSRHLALLMQHGLVRRESRGTAVYYRVSDESVYALCDLVCGSIARRLDDVVHGRTLFGAAAASVAQASAPAPAEASARRPRGRRVKSV
ncbi:MAG: metalloregulator ArsR/SmtB family transcription factor [Pseudomonadota bacterium]